MKRRELWLLSFTCQLESEPHAECGWHSSYLRHDIDSYTKANEKFHGFESTHANRAVDVCLCVWQRWWNVAKQLFNTLVLDSTYKSVLRCWQLSNIWRKTRTRGNMFLVLYQNVSPVCINKQLYHVVVSILCRWIDFEHENDKQFVKNNEPPVTHGWGLKKFHIVVYQSFTALEANKIAKVSCELWQFQRNDLQQTYPVLCMELCCTLKKGALIVDESVSTCEMRSMCLCIFLRWQKGTCYVSTTTRNIPTSS